MSYIGRVLSFLSRKVKTSVHTDEIVECPIYQTSGVDAIPLPQDRAVLLNKEKSHSKVAVAFYDHNGDNLKSSTGEVRIYSRDAEGNLLSEIYLDNTGQVTITSSIAVKVEADLDLTGHNLLNVGDADINHVQEATHIHTVPQGGVTGLPQN